MFINKIIHDTIIALVAVSLLVYMIMASVIVWKKLYSMYIVTFLGTVSVGIRSLTVLAQLIYPTVLAEHIDFVFLYLFISSFPIIPLIFPNRPFQKKYLWWAIPAVLCALLSLIPGSAATVVSVSDFGAAIPEGGWLDIPRKIFYMGYLYLTIALFIHRIYTAKTDGEKMTLQYMMFAFLIFGNIAGVTNVVLPIFGIHEFYPVGSLMGLTFSISVLTVTSMGGSKFTTEALTPTNP